MVFIVLIDKDQLINDNVKSHAFYDLYSLKSCFLTYTRIESLQRLKQKNEFFQI